MSVVTNRNAGVGSQVIVDDTTPDWTRYLVRIGHHRDREAFRRLFDKFSPLIKAFAGRQAPFDLSENMAEELVQETMIKVWQKAESFDPKKANASTWIFTIARNTRIDLIRKNARHQLNKASSNQADYEFDVDDIWIDSDDEDVFNQLAMQRSSENLHASLEDLPDEQAFILKKVYLEDKSHSEIAEELELPLGTVKSRVRLALSKLRLSVER